MVSFNIAQTFESVVYTSEALFTKDETTFLDVGMITS